MRGVKSIGARVTWPKLSVCVAVGLLIAGCGGSNNATDAASDEAEHIESAGRLAITEAALAGVHVFSLDDHRQLATVATSFVPSALYTSPSYRYAVAIQRDEDLVQFVDGGLWQEDHVDHLHDYADDPALAALQVDGIRPTHYEVFDEVAALFMDGNADTGQTASVISVTDAGIESGASLAALSLPMQMHGTAEPRGDYLLSTWRAPSNADTLPEMVELYRRRGSGYEFVQQFDTPCPSLHGSFSNEFYSAFGCADGVLIIAQTGDTFNSFKISNPVDMPVDARIGTVLGHRELSTFIGLAGDNGVVEIDPVAGTMKFIDWSADGTRVAQTFDHEAANFLVLDDLGMLHVLDVSNGWSSRGTVAVTGAVSEGHPNASLDAHPGAARVFVADTQGQRIVVVDTESVAIADQMPLAFVPGAVRWLGIAQSHDHD